MTKILLEQIVVQDHLTFNDSYFKMLKENYAQTFVRSPKVKWAKQLSIPLKKLTTPDLANSTTILSIQADLSDKQLVEYRLKF